ncbi:MAG: exodeoxyribonuclease VII small subunit [Bacteroidales bacterium]|nr:exodeoxyribonuclease VII small subunit [Candidatus Liminaster caballi]
MAKKETLTYTAAMAELEQLVAQLQRPDCEIDKLCELTLRATELVRFCQEKLTKTDEQLVKLLDDIE